MWTKEIVFLQENNLFLPYLSGLPFFTTLFSSPLSQARFNFHSLSNCQRIRYNRSTSTGTVFKNHRSLCASLKCSGCLDLSGSTVSRSTYTPKITIHENYGRVPFLETRDSVIRTCCFEIRIRNLKIF